VRVTVLKNSAPIDSVLIETPDLEERYEIFVGRADDCHVIIRDPLISRHHLVLKNADGNWVCKKETDLGVISVGGIAGDSLPVKEGDEIKCGVYSLIISDLPKSMTTEISSSEPVTNLPTEDTSLEDNDLEAIEPATLDDNDFDAPLTSPESETFDSPAPDELGASLSDDLGGEISSEFVEQGSDIGAEDNGFAQTEDLSAEFGEEVAGFGDEVSEFGGEMDESTRVDRSFLSYALTLFGEHAPYDRYQLTEAETFIGRDGKKCQILLNDPEVSTVHAVIRKNGGEITIEDLNSSNGTILNGERINRSQLSPGDEFVIGGTSFTLEVRSDLLEAESERLMPVESNQVIETEEIEEEEMSLEDAVNFEDSAPPEKSFIKRIWKNPEQRKKAIYVIVGLTLAFVLFYEEEPEQIKPKNAPKVAKTAEPKMQLSKELESKRNIAYELGFDYFNQRKYNEALQQFQIVNQIDPNYKEIQSFLEQTKASLKRIAELEAEKRAAEERIKTKKIIDELLVKAREAVKERQVTLAENYFGQITEKDPENIEVQQLKMELEAWQKEEERKKLEAAAKAAQRKAMVDALAPGKTLYLKKEWYKSILKLEDFLRKKGMDEDLIKSASDMLSDAKNQLNSELGPIIGRARSLKEGQDLKAAYEAYQEVLKLEPTNAEALNEIDDIKTQLDGRSKRIYREAIISESLSLFNDAKEKFQEVQQISPTDSEYYKKASDKLKNYLE
jgi:pSer/pThr/pTyr-binding forkhead associated (FHA) protein